MKIHIYFNFEYPEEGNSATFPKFFPHGEGHYMILNCNYKYKGISIKKRESPEEYILKLFIDKIGKLPIAQNILICSKETSIEEIQSFLYRAILCEYNTLFAIEILESFSNFQHNKMYSYIDKLLYLTQSSVNLILGKLRVILVIEEWPFLSIVVRHHT